MSKLGLKFDIELIQRNPSEIINYFKNLELPAVKELFQEIYCKISFLKYNLDKLFEHLGNEKEPKYR